MAYVYPFGHPRKGLKCPGKCSVIQLLIGYLPLQSLLDMWHRWRNTSEHLINTAFMQDEVIEFQGRNITISVGAAVAFGLGILATLGSTKAEEFFAGYLLEQSLSIDNLFVFILVFDYFKTPIEAQAKVGLPWHCLSVVFLPKKRVFKEFIQRCQSGSFPDWNRLFGFADLKICSWGISRPSCKGNMVGFSKKIASLYLCVMEIC